MQMILPTAREISGRGPRRVISRTASRAQRNMPVRLTPITVFHCSSVISLKAASFCSPALLTRMSIVPHAASISRNMACTWSSRETSARMASARLPPARISSATRSAVSGAET